MLLVRKELQELTVLTDSLGLKVPQGLLELTVYKGFKDPLVSMGQLALPELMAPKE